MSLKRRWWTRWREERAPEKNEKNDLEKLTSLDTNQPNNNNNDDNNNSAADALADGTNVRLPRMGGGASQKSGKTRAAAAASVRAVAPAAPAAAATPAAAAAATPAALSSPAGAVATTPADPSGPRRQASPGSAFARRERKGEVVASLRPEIELPPPTTAAAAEAGRKKKKNAATSMETDDDEAPEASASAAAALDDLPRAAAAVELLTAAPPRGSKVMTDSLADRAAFVEARIERFAAAFEKAAAAAAAAGGPLAPAIGEGEEDPASLGSAPVAPVGVARQTARGVFVGRVVDGGSGGGDAATTTPAPSAPDAADAPPPPPRLDLHSASLEGSAALSGGRRARLDVSALRHRWRLFPGQVVAVVGACPAGHTLVASALLPSAPPPRAAAAAAPRAGGESSSSSAAATGMKVVAASGPFTAPGDVAFEALDAVLALAAGKGSSPPPPSSASSSSRPADAVVLVGPFVDERHPAVSSGSLDVSFDELFEREVVSRIAEWSRNFGRECGEANRPPPPVVLLPSPRDVAAGALTSAFPAKPLELPAGTPRNVVALPNPATFRVGGLVFGATGHDVLKDLSASQAAGGLGDGGDGAKNAPPSSSPSSSSAAAAAAAPAPLPGVAPKDRMAGLAGALLEQGCFYPVYPPARGTMLDARLALGSDAAPPPPTSSSSSSPSAAAGAGAPSSSFSSSSSARPYPGLAMPFSPDVLLLPSDLAPFARVATAEAPPALRVDESGELVVSPPSSSSALPPPQPGVEAVAVNPGRAVTAGGGGGTAAVIILGARKKGEEKAADAADADDVVSRCRVDIVRL